MDPDIWRLAEEASKEDSSSTERTLLVVGDHRAGKSSLIEAFLMSNNEAPKSTVALEYSYARAPLELESNRDLVHIYELGGGRMMSNLIDVPLNAANLAGISVVIALDLSHPHRVLDSLLFWLQIISNRVRSEMSNLPPYVASVFEKRIQKKWSRHEDIEYMTPIPLPVLVIASKYDVFANEESENMKWMGRALRYFCEKFGVSLMYYSSKENELVSAVRGLLNEYLYNNPSRKYDEKDYALPIEITSGNDSFREIGKPPASRGMEDEPDKLWQKAFAKAFPRK